MLSLFKTVPVAFLVSAHAAAVPPDAGSLGNQLRQMSPPASPARKTPPLDIPSSGHLSHEISPGSTTRVTLRHVRFEGDVQLAGIPPSRLEDAVAGYLGTPQTFAGLQSMTDTITALCRAEGLLAARATLPPQTVKDGVLRIRIIAGHYDAGKIKNTSAMKTSVAQRLVSVTTPQGELIRRAQLEREALLLSELPGVSARISLMPGDAPGTSAPVVDIQPGSRISGYAGLDNQGDKTTGRSRAVAGLQVNNPLGLGDRLSLDLMDAWEKSDLFSGSLGYSLPAGGYGTRVGGGYSHLNYRYILLQNSFSGYSDNWGLYVTHPYVRSAAARADIRLDGGQQFLTDKYPSVISGNADSRARKVVNTLSPSLTGSAAFIPGGVSGFSLRGTLGDVDYRNNLARLMSFSNESGTAGSFMRLNWAVNHEQTLWGPVSVYGSLSGQLADHNLDSSQKLLLGGPAGVRAYDTGDGSVTEGTLFTAEVRNRWTLPVPVAGNNPDLTIAAFFDQGAGEQYDSNRSRSGGMLTSHNRVNLSGAGLYTTLSESGRYALTLTWAHRTGEADPVSGQGDRDRFWVSAVKSF
ncbi:ShlB/FhaC/HecB family hemolysin secretion/activation protein [Citrobacter sp. C411]|uniref:ShlB/FhaC/HecB family hemolysin secretion/activation protein n=1 Tax=Citrobacter sp. C411 TaxID=3048144 RepID=UPI0039C2B56D